MVKDGILNNENFSILWWLKVIDINDKSSGLFG